MTRIDSIRANHFIHSTDSRSPIHAYWSLPGIQLNSTHLPFFLPYAQFPVAVAAYAIAVRAREYGESEGVSVVPVDADATPVRPAPAPRYAHAAASAIMEEA